MRRRIISILFASMFFVLVNGVVAQAAMGDSLLRIGSFGQDVVELQTKLNYLGFDAGKVDGIFGNLTKEAVVQFQASRTLSTDGIVGPITASSLNQAYADKQRETKASAILTTAKQLIGVRYQWGGSTPETGFDCSGFTSYVFSQSGLTIPRVSRDQYTIGTPVTFDKLMPGDLVFFSFSDSGTVSHVGIYLGDGQFINSSSSKGVTIYPFGPYWKSVFVGARRVF